MLINHIEVTGGGFPSSQFLKILTFNAYSLFLVEFKLVAELAHHSSVLLEYKIQNLSLTSNSRQDLELDPKFIPSVQIDLRDSYKFCLPVHYTFL